MYTRVRWKARRGVRRRATPAGCWARKCEFVVYDGSALLRRICSFMLTMPLLSHSARTVEQLGVLYSQPQAVAGLSIPAEVIKSVPRPPPWPTAFVPHAYLLLVC